MPRSFRRLQIAPCAFATLVALTVLALPASAFAVPAGGHSPAQNGHQVPEPGTLKQLPGVARLPGRSLGAGRRLRDRTGPRRAWSIHGLARDRVSPDGKNVYVASSRSDAIAIFRRNPQTGALGQPGGTSGCVAAKGADGCAKAVGLNGPNSVAVSPDGRNVYATSRGSNAVTVFRATARPARSRQLPAGAGCISGLSGARSARPAGAARPRTSSSSAPTARTSTSARSSATPWRSSTAIRPAARSPSRRTAPAASPTATSGCAAGVALGRRREWRSAATARASTSPPLCPTPSSCLSATRRPAPSPRPTGRQRLHRRQPAHRLHHRGGARGAPTR